jgi:hypothetical protein
MNTFKVKALNDFEPIGLSPIKAGDTIELSYANQSQSILFNLWQNGYFHPLDASDVRNIFGENWTELPEFN